RPETLDSAEAVARFQREARAVARLQHPHIVAVYDSGLDGAQHYIVYALVEGQSLAQALGPDGIDPKRAAWLTARLAEALHYAHERGILHRDVKPANVMLDDRSQPVLVDFGLARQSAVNLATLTNPGALLGTPGYMPPEQLGDDSGNVGNASDLYSLGVT